MPEIIYQDLAISLDKKDQKIYDQLEQKLILEIGKEKKPIDNKSTNYIRCQQFANGIIYTNKSKSIEKIHNEKIKALQLLIDSLQGKNLLVAYWYKSDLKLLQDNFKNLAVYNSDDPTIVDKWNNGEIPLLVGQAKTISMGLNLQFGGHHICWFSLSNRADLFHQLNARLARPRQNETVFIYQIVCKDTIDEAIKKDTEKKEETQKKFLEYFERRWK
jgi:SNF2 family DNA or RNA helicase